MLVLLKLFPPRQTGSLQYCSAGEREIVGGLRGALQPLILLRHLNGPDGVQYYTTASLGASEAPFRWLVATQCTLKLSGFPAGNGSCRFTQAFGPCLLSTMSPFDLLWHCISCFRLPCCSSGLQLQRSRHSSVLFHVIAELVAGC